MSPSSLKTEVVLVGESSSHKDRENFKLWRVEKALLELHTRGNPLCGVSRLSLRHFILWSSLTNLTGLVALC